MEIIWSQLGSWPGGTDHAGRVPWRTIRNSDKEIDEAMSHEHLSLWNVRAHLRRNQSGSRGNGIQDLIQAAAKNRGAPAPECGTDPHVSVHRAANSSAHNGELACATGKAPVPNVDIDSSKPFATRDRKTQMALALQVVSSHRLCVLDIESALSFHPAFIHRMFPHAATESQALKRPNFPPPLLPHA